MQILPEDVEFLEHFGVKGMKWGVRKAANVAKDGPTFVKSVLRQIGSKKMSDLPDIRKIHYSHGYQILNVVQAILDASS